MPLSYAHVSDLYLRGDDRNRATPRDSLFRPRPSPAPAWARGPVRTLPASGTIIFVPSVSQIVVDGALTRVSPVRAVLDRGHVSAHVLATDVGTPTGCTWQVRHRIGGDFEQFDIEAPSGAEIDLPTVTPISASRGTGVDAQVRTVPVGRSRASRPS
jgi:hypothetical protein